MKEFKEIMELFDSMGPIATDGEKFWKVRLSEFGTMTCAFPIIHYTDGIWTVAFDYLPDEETGYVMYPKYFNDGNTLEEVVDEAYEWYSKLKFFDEIMKTETDLHFKKEKHYNTKHIPYNGEEHCVYCGKVSRHYVLADSNPNDTLEYYNCDCDEAQKEHEINETVENLENEIIKAKQKLPKEKYAIISCFTKLPE